MRPPGRFTEAVAVRQARRLRLPGEPRLVVLYHPGQYPLGRAICSHYADVELWYVRPRTPDPATEPGRLAEFDELAVGRATRVVRAEDPDDTEALRGRLLALEVINPRAFIPGALISRR